MTDVLFPDWIGKTRNYTKTTLPAEPIDFRAIEAEIAVALWNNDAGTVGFNPVYLAPEKDPA